MMKQKLKRIPKKVGTKIRSKVIATLLRMRHWAITFYGEMKRGREFPSVTSGQLHSMSPIPSPTLSAPSPRVNEGMSQGTPACPSSCASTSASKRGRGRTRGDHFDLDYTRQEDVRTVVETMMTARRTHRNRMHAYFKKFPSKEAALLKPHPDTTEEQWKELCDLFTSEAFMKNQESGNINPAELYKKNYTNKDGFGPRKEREKFMNGWMPSSVSHQLAKARDEIEAMRAAREKDLQEFAKKQAEMEATLRDHREEQRVEQEEHEKGARACKYEECMHRNKSACERSKSAYGQKYRRNWRRKCPL
ncbi:hypothetical protein CJ030_MR8G004876 [Morella rubra]|uniref:Uncharacterized protein n=1 Tax=Morella rubra TaxID=262757 RepID=A0A6A1USB8_9ROSI|nr:hypothetical protein CJ030_MR8G004876 [Morella rubra]